MVKKLTKIINQRIGKVNRDDFSEMIFYYLNNNYVCFHI